MSEEVQLQMAYADNPRMLNATSRLAVLNDKLVSAGSHFKLVAENTPGDGYCLFHAICSAAGMTSADPLVCRISQIASE